MGRVTEACGRIDVLFANAGISHCPPIAQTDGVFFDQIMGVNVKGIFFCLCARCAFFAGSVGGFHRLRRR